MKTITGLLILCSALVQFPLRAAKWEIEPVDASGIAKYSSLRIDKNGNAHVIYVVEDLGNQLRYGFWDHVLKKWFTMRVDDGASFASLTLDSNQRPHVSYADIGTCEGCRLKYAYWDGMQWKRQAIPLNSLVIAYYTSIALDAKDRPTIGFYEYRGARGSDFITRMREVSWTGTRWEVQTMEGNRNSGKFNAMAFDQHGLMRLAYTNVDAMTAGVRMATWDGREWRTEIVDNFIGEDGRHEVGYSLGMALDKAGIPHLSYWDITPPASVRYATLVNGHWVVEVADAHPGQPAYWDRNSIAVDDEGHPYMTYYDGRGGQLHLAHKEGGRWLVETVDAEMSGFTSSLQIDHGTIWITYADETNHELKVARRPIATSPGAGTNKDKSPAQKQNNETGPEQPNRAKQN